jgi:hypothetical protein
MYYLYEKSNKKENKRSLREAEGKKNGITCIYNPSEIGL